MNYYVIPEPYKMEQLEGNFYFSYDTILLKKDTDILELYQIVCYNSSNNKKEKRSYYGKNSIDYRCNERLRLGDRKAF